MHDVIARMDGFPSCVQLDNLMLTEEYSQLCQLMNHTVIIQKVTDAQFDVIWNSRYETNPFCDVWFYGINIFELDETLSLCSSFIKPATEPPGIQTYLDKWIN
jgi:hypothetical protein